MRAARLLDYGVDALVIEAVGGASAYQALCRALCFLVIFFLTFLLATLCGAEDISALFEAFGLTKTTEGRYTKTEDEDELRAPSREKALVPRMF